MGEAALAAAGCILLRQTDGFYDSTGNSCAFSFYPFLLTPMPVVTEEAFANAVADGSPVACLMEAIALALARGEPSSAVAEMLAPVGLHFDAQRAWLIRFNRDQSIYWVAHEWCADGVPACLPELPGVPTALIADVMIPFRNGEPVLLPDIEELPPSSQALKEELRREGIRATCAVPLFDDARLVALIGLDDTRRRRDWHPGEVELLGRIGRILLAAEHRGRAAPTGNEPPTSSPEEESPDGCYVRTGNCHVQVRWTEIAWLKADGDYSRVRLRSGQEFYERRTLQAWTAVLPTEQFSRVHRSWIVNVNAIRELRRGGGGRWSIVVHGREAPIPVGRQYQRATRERINLSTVRGT